MTEPTPLAAPEPSPMPSPLSAPRPVAEVTPQQAATAVPVDPAVADALRRNAEGFVQQLLAVDVHSPVLDQRVRDISTMGDAEVKASSQLSSRMLDRRARSGSVGARQGGPEQVAGEQLVRLRQEVEELDPCRCVDGGHSEPESNDDPGSYDGGWTGGASPSAQESPGAGPATAQH